MQVNEDVVNRCYVGRIGWPDLMSENTGYSPLAALQAADREMTQYMEAKEADANNTN